MTRKRETAAQRDERIVREAGPWTGIITDDGDVTFIRLLPRGRLRSNWKRCDEAIGAIIRMLNRLRAPRGKRGRNDAG